MSCNLLGRMTRHPFLIFALTALALVAGCKTDQVDVPDLTGPSGHRLFITMSADPDHLVIKAPGKPRECSRITAQLKDQLGNGVPGENIKFRIANAEGSEVNIGSLDNLKGTTDSGGFARVTYCAPNTAEQPVPTQIFIFAILTNPSYPFEVTDSHAIDLESALPPSGCIFGGPGAPLPSFTFTPGAPVVNEEVCFDATGSTDNGTIVAASWSFGDGGTATGLTPCHTFRSNGVFVVVLTVQDEDRNCATTTQTITIGEGGAPTCSFTISPTTPELDQEVIFDSSSSEDEDGNIVSRTWTFGDGGSASGVRVTHTFTDPGSFVVQLTLRDDQGNVSTCQQTVTIGIGLLPICSFTFTAADFTAPFEVSFDASASSDPDGTIVSYAWEFGDNSTATNPNPLVVHSYQVPGTYTVTLTVTDNDGNFVSCTQEVSVGLPPDCGFTVSGELGDGTSPFCVSELVTFDPDDIANATLFAWDFGDGNTANTIPPNNATHRYTTAGTFTATLTVTDAFGGTSTCTQTVTVLDDPTITSFAPSGGVVGTQVIITGTNFQSEAEGGHVFFGGVEVGSFTVDGTRTQITTTVPAGATDNTISVQTDCGTATSGTIFDICGTLSINDVSVPESTLGLPNTGSFTVTSSETCSVAQSATFTFVSGAGSESCLGGLGGDATLGTDFTASGGTVTIPAGQTTGETSDFTTIVDAVAETPGECFRVVLTNPVNTSITDGTGLGSITE